MDERRDQQVISISNGTIIRCILFVLLVYVLFLLHSLILVLLTAIVIASFAEAAVRRFKRIGVGRILAVILVYGMLVLLLAGLFYLLVPVIVAETSHIIDLLNKYLPSENILGNINATDLSGASSFVDKISGSGGITSLAENIQIFISNVSGGFFQAITALFGGLLNVVLIFIISFYLSIQEGGIEKFLRIVSPPHNHEYIVGLWGRTQRKIALWIKGQLILGVIVGILVYITLLILGLPYAALLAIATMFFELIPFGVTLAMIPATGIAYATGGISLAALVLLAYVVIQQIENYILQPLIAKKVVGISPLVVILAVLAGYTLGGVWGLVLAVPVAVAILEYIDDIERKRVAFGDAGK